MSKNKVRSSDDMVKVSVKDPNEKEEGDFIQFIEVTLHIPKIVVDFLTKWHNLTGEDMELFINDAIEHEIKGMVQHATIFNTPWSSTNNVIEYNKLDKLPAFRK
jgi:hypothetical protein